MNDTINTNAPIITTPLSCAMNVADSVNSPTANVPQIPATKWTESAPTGSSILNLSNIGTASTTINPPTIPTPNAYNIPASGAAVTDTRPAKAPFNTIVKSTFLYKNWVNNAAITAPAAAAILVLATTIAIPVISSLDPNANWEPPLNPNHPIHRMNVPNVANAKFEPGIGLTLPSAVYLPFLAPRIKTPANAAHPPTEWTIVDPAKSEKPAKIPPNSDPPHVQCPCSG